MGEWREGVGGGLQGRLFPGNGGEVMSQEGGTSWVLGPSAPPATTWGMCPPLNPCRFARGWAFCDAFYPQPAIGSRQSVYSEAS